MIPQHPETPVPVAASGHRWPTPVRASTGSGSITPRQALRDLVRALTDGIQVARRHESLPVANLRRHLAPLLESLAADPDTVPWLIATELKTGLLVQRAVEGAATMALFARRVGLDADVTAELALGALSMDVGKITIPVPILAKAGPLSTAERGYVRRHVRRGLYLVRNGALISEALNELFLGHHERLDGSGYPRGIRGTQVPIPARMAGIVDTYGALVQRRHYAAATSPHDALRLIHGDRGTLFDAALVREFIRSMGIYPTGCWVQLGDGRLGIVRNQDPDEPRRPQVLLVSDSAGRALPGPAALWMPRRRGDIVRALTPGELRLNPRVMNEAFAAASLAA